MTGSEPSSITFAIKGPIARTDLAGLCDRVCRILACGDATLAYCDVAGVNVDAVTVDALARLQLAALRHGYHLKLQHATPELRELVAFMGLPDVLAE